LQAKAEASNTALENDRRLHPLAANPGNFPYPRWDGHEAQHLLKLDVDDNKYKTMKPADLHKTHQDYECFPLTVFWRHIQQEVRQQTKSFYWLAKSNQI
jgi:hypothetical protein